jgi:hypothetical protein
MEASITFSASSSSYRFVCRPKAQAKGGRDQKNRQASDLLTHRKKKEKKTLQMMIMVMIMMQIFCARNQSETQLGKIFRERARESERESERRERELGYRRRRPSVVST